MKGTTDMIKSWTDLSTAIVGCVSRMPDGTLEECSAWADADPEVQRLLKLHNIYLEAESNPPDGVIGVGIITYANQKMMEAQQDG